MHKIRQDIIRESKNFFVKVGVGILAPGHVMLVPKHHISCFAELPIQLRKEFLAVKEEISNELKSNFSDPIVYEHGIYGQSINHAHVHFVPSKNRHYKLKNLKENLFKGLKSTLIDSPFEIVNIFKEGGSYFYLEEKGKKWIFHTKDQPKGKFIFRKEFARLTGLYGLEDWRLISKEEKQRNLLWIKTTKKMLTNIKEGK